MGMKLLVFGEGGYVRTLHRVSRGPGAASLSGQALRISTAVLPESVRSYGRS